MPPLRAERPNLTRAPEKELTDSERELKQLGEQIKEATDEFFPAKGPRWIRARKTKSPEVVYVTSEPHHRLNKAWLTRWEGRLFTTTILTVEVVGSIDSREERKIKTEYDVSTTGEVVLEGKKVPSHERALFGDGFVIEDRIQFAKNILDTIRLIPPVNNTGKMVQPSGSK